MPPPVLPPGPRSRLPWGQVRAFARDPLGFLQHVARTYGDIVYFKLGPQHVYFLNHPTYIHTMLSRHYQDFPKGRGAFLARKLLGEGLLTSSGELHRQQRRLLQPALQRQHLSRYEDSITACSMQLQEHWRHHATVDMAQEMMQVTLAIIGKMLFGTEMANYTQGVGRALTDITALFPRFSLPFPQLLWYLPLPGNYRLWRARRYLDGLIYRAIALYRAGQTHAAGALSLFLQPPDGGNHDENGAGMTDTHLRDEVMTLLLAGHETMANALTWSWYLLSQHAEVEDRLHAELDTVLQGRLPTVQDLPALRYTEMVFAEALRLYPPVWSITRRAAHDMELGGYVIPAGAAVRASQFVMHRDARFFPDPQVFEPLRWTPEARAARPRFAYFPFGGGPRHCIGEGFAWTEGILLLASLAARWRMRLVPGHPVQAQPLVTLRPKYGMRMTLQQR